ncbi:MAG: ribosomal-processing cysteine protease Prp [Firmicutes bacterium]|nr:ribosomal-processing cysteine protease Prp [Bacillota bacterium]
MRITVGRDERSDIVTVRAEGHSGYAPSGSDIVCAAVSAVVQTAVLGVRQAAGCEAVVKTGDALIEAKFARRGAKPAGPADAGQDAEGGGSQGWPEAQAILEAMLLGLREIEDGRRRYVRVTETRVEGGATT